MSENRERIGGNNPPEPIEETPDQKMEREDKPLFARFAELELGKAKIPVEITSEDIAGRATSFVAQCRLAITDLVKVHGQRKAPFLAMTRLLDTRYLRKRDKFQIEVVDAVEQRVEAFRKRKQAEQRAREAEARRKAAEEARIAEERAVELTRQAGRAETAGNRRDAATLAAEAEHYQNAAAERHHLANMPDQPVRIHGEHGATAFVQVTWKFYIADPEALPANYWKPDEQAIQEELTHAIKTGGKPPDIPGVEFYEEERGRIRRC